MPTARNSLTTSNKTAAVAEKKGKTIFDVIQAGAKQFATALPKHINSERFVRIAITTIRQNPKLAKCSQESLLGALMVSAQLGLGFKPCYKWMTFNTQSANKNTLPQQKVLNLVING